VDLLEFSSTSQLGTAQTTIFTSYTTLSPASSTVVVTAPVVVVTASPVVVTEVQTATSSLSATPPDAQNTGSAYSNSPVKNKFSSGAIAGSIIGISVAVIAFCALCAWLWRRRKRQGATQDVGTSSRGVSFWRRRPAAPANGTNIVANASTQPIHSHASGTVGSGVAVSGETGRAQQSTLHEEMEMAQLKEPKLTEYYYK
jgi:hypothetical protein